MNIIFLTLIDFKTTKDQGIYHDFINELKKYSKKIVVVSPNERRNKHITEIISEDKVDILKVKTGNITKTNKIEKGISTLFIEKNFQKAINQYYKHTKFDLIVYSTPPMTFSKLISNLKYKNNAKTYLLLKDIFPQNAVDLKMFKSTGIIYRYFRKKEIETYNVSDLIGCMSPGNKKYLLQENKDIDKSKVHIFRNATYSNDIQLDQSQEIFRDLNIDSKKISFIYGGNIGLPQGIHNIKKVMARFHEIPNSNLIILGNGTKFEELKQYALSINNKNIHVFDRLPKAQYNQLLKISDIGLIFLDEKFTIPNYPSRLTSYLQLSKPILVSSDVNTDIGTEVVEKEAGLWNLSTNIDQFIKNAKTMVLDENLRLNMARNARKFFDEEFRIENNVENMFNEINKYHKEIRG